jgi:hypothetical protein
MIIDQELTIDLEANKIQKSIKRVRSIRTLEDAALASGMDQAMLDNEELEEFFEIQFLVPETATDE